MLAVFRRELRAYFASPIGFVFVGFFILIAGVFFAISNLLSGNPDLHGRAQQPHVHLPLPGPHPHHAADLRGDARRRPTSCSSPAP